MMSGAGVRRDRRQVDRLGAPGDDEAATVCSGLAATSSTLEPMAMSRELEAGAIERPPPDALA